MSGPKTVAMAIRNGSSAGVPWGMLEMAGTHQQGILQTHLGGLILFRRDVNGHPYASSSYKTHNLSLDVPAAYGLNLPINPVDDHWKVAFGLDSMNRIHMAGNAHSQIEWQGRAGQNYIYSTTAWTPDTPPPSGPELTWVDPDWASLPWSANGANRHTYNHFSRMTDGTLVWFMHQGDLLLDGRGRDYLAYYLSPGPELTWRPLLGPNYGEFAKSELLGPADAVYLGDVVIEKRATGDRIHVTWHYRDGNADGASSIAPCYAYSDWIGFGSHTHWKNAFGATVTAPFTWDTRAEVAIESAPGRGGSGRMAIDHKGLPHMIMRNGTSLGGQLFNGDNPVPNHVRCHFNGSAWIATKVVDPGATYLPNIRRLGNDVCMLTSFNDRIRIQSNGADAVSETWFLGGAVDSVLQSSYPETFTPDTDPTALMQHGRWDILCGDGDVPRVVSAGLRTIRSV